MRLSFVGSTGAFGSTHSSRLPLPLVSRMNGVQPCARSSSPVSSNTLRLNQPMTWLPASPLVHSVLFASSAKTRWCVWKHVLISVNLPRLRVVHRKMAVRALDRERLRRRMVRAFPAEAGIRRRPHARREPDASLFVEHRIVHARLAVPDRVLAPVRRGRHRIVPRRRRRRIAHGMHDLGRDVPHRIEHRNAIGAFFGRAVDRAVRVDGGFALVGRDLVVQIGGRAAPVPDASARRCARRLAAAAADARESRRRRCDRSSRRRARARAAARARPMLFTMLFIA